MGRIMKGIVAFLAVLLAAGIFGMAASAWAASTQAAPANVALIGPGTLGEHLRAGPRSSFIALFDLHVANNQSTPISYFRHAKKGFNLSVTSDSAHSSHAPKIVALGTGKSPKSSWKPARLAAEGISTVRV